MREDVAHVHRMGKTMTSWPWLCVAVAVSTVPVALVVDRIVPSPYMDEIFHIPQAQQYCKGNFSSWDPMITTPPGLYLFSIIHSSFVCYGMKMMGGVVSLLDLCSPAALRSVNIIFGIICTILFQNICLHLEPKIGCKGAFLKALALSWYPLHWFFMFLYYTDVGSTTAVMAMYLACLKGAYWMSGMLGLVAILFRQTNAVWTVFVACVGVIDFLTKQRFQVTGKPDSTHYKKFLPANCSGPSFDTNSTIARDVTEFQGLKEEVIILLCLAWQKRFALIRRFFPLMLPIIAFLAFIAYNGSIVLGAKEAHKASPHFAQIFYFGAASVLAMAPIYFNLHLTKANFWMILDELITSLVGYRFAALVGALACVHFFSLAHPYLLSDNRHYTFYIWRRAINFHWTSKYFLSVVYIYSWHSILLILGRKERKVWLLLFFLAVAGVLVPAPLIELRYYTIPFYFIALHTPMESRKGHLVWVLICVQYVVVNLSTMYVFLFKPFYNSYSKEAQRFIW